MADVNDNGIITNEVLNYDKDGVPYSSAHPFPSSVKDSALPVGGSTSALQSATIAAITAVGVTAIAILTFLSAISAQNPLSADGDSVYVKDVWLAESTSVGFTGGDVTDLTNNLHTAIENTSTDSPKTILVHFERTIVSNSMGLGSYGGGNFSNVKIEIGTSGDVFYTVIDDSADSTKLTSETYKLPITAGFNALRITFHTADTITLSNLVVLKSNSVVARLQAAKPDNTIADINATAGGNLKVSIEEYEHDTNKDFYLAVAEGEIAGYSIVSKFGQNDNIGTVAYEEIWDMGGVYPYPADGTAPITHIDCSDVTDTEPIEIQGLDIAGVLTVQTKTSAGTALVALDPPLWRVFRLKNEGTSDIVSTCQAINVTDTVIYAQIQNGNNQTLMALYTIPLGETGYLLQGSNNIIGTNRAYSIYGRLMMRQYGGVFQLKKTFGLSADGTSFFVLPAPLPAKIPALTDIKVSAISSAAGGGVNTTFEILLISD